MINLEVSVRMNLFYGSNHTTGLGDPVAPAIEDRLGDHKRRAIPTPVFTIKLQRDFSS
jgi:hypothetical protein